MKKVTKRKNEIMKAFPLTQKEGYSFFEVTRCLEHAQQENVVITSEGIEFVNEVLKFLVDAYDNEKVSVETITSKKRTRILVDVRSLVSYALNRKGISQKVVGGFLAGRDHSAIHHCLARHDDNLRQKDSYYDFYKKVFKSFDAFVDSVCVNAVFLPLCERRRLDLYRLLQGLGFNENQVEHEFRKHVKKYPTF